MPHVEEACWLLKLWVTAEPADVTACMLGTTQFVNACVQRQELVRTAVIRLCGPATHALPPFCDMPEDIAASIMGPCYMLSGKYTMVSTSAAATRLDSAVEGRVPDCVKWKLACLA